MNVFSDNVSLFFESIKEKLKIYCNVLFNVNIINKIVAKKFLKTIINYNFLLMNSRNLILKDLTL